LTLNLFMQLYMRNLVALLIRLSDLFVLNEAQGLHHSF